MDTKKYASNEVFDVKVYMKSDGSDCYSVAFNIKTTNQNTIKYERGRRFLEVTDALIDLGLMEEIMNGKYDGKELKIVCDTYMRDVESYIDENVEVTFHSAELYRFAFLGYVGGTASVTFGFTLDMGEDDYISVKVSKE